MEIKYPVFRVLLNGCTYRTFSTEEKAQEFIDKQPFVPGWKYSICKMLGVSQ